MAAFCRSLGFTERSMPQTFSTIGKNLVLCGASTVPSGSEVDAAGTIVASAIFVGTLVASSIITSGGGTGGSTFDYLTVNILETANAIVFTSVTGPFATITNLTATNVRVPAGTVNVSGAVALTGGVTIRDTAFNGVGLTVVNPARAHLGLTYADKGYMWTNETVAGVTITTAGTYYPITPAGAPNAQQRVDWVRDGVGLLAPVLDGNKYGNPVVSGMYRAAFDAYVAMPTAPPAIVAPTDFRVLIALATSVTAPLTPIAGSARTISTKYIAGLTQWENTERYIVTLAYFTALSNDHVVPIVSSNATGVILPFIDITLDIAYQGLPQ